MAHLVRNPDNSSPAILQLGQRLNDFYSTANTYLAFEEPVDQSGWFALFRGHLQKLLGLKPRLDVLELGSGRSVFGTFLGDLRPRITYHAQDITPKNREHLQSQADHVHVCDISNIQGDFDLIFHTFVFEHISTPRPFLQQVDAHLRPGGYHIVICPRYDLPGYICPSMRHLSRPRRWLHGAFLTGSRCAALLDRRSRFWVNTDPAMFHGPWYRDADAVHLVAGFDVNQWHRRHGYAVENLHAYAHPPSSFLQRRITLAIACKKGAPKAV